jgi:broad specificity phosphatase PhoE
MPRLVTFMRHGESAHNPHVSLGKQLQKDGTDPARAAELLDHGRRMLNPSLTESGRRQAAAVRAELESSGERFDLVITTPLARTIETTQISVGSLADRILLTPELCETAEDRLGGPQRGHSLPRTVQAHPFVAGWDTSHVRESGLSLNWVAGAPIPLEPSGHGYHHPRPVEERLAAAVAWLRMLEEPRVLVVGHSGVLDRILGRGTLNCERVQHDLG